MTRKITITISVLLLLLMALIIGCSVATAEDDEVGEIATRINKLRDDKNQCLDELTYEQSRLSLTGKERFCYENDDEIMKLQEELDRILIKDYMKIDTTLGLEME